MIFFLLSAGRAGGGLEGSPAYGRRSGVQEGGDHVGHGTAHQAGTAIVVAVVVLVVALIVVAVVVVVVAAAVVDVAAAVVVVAAAVVVVSSMVSKDWHGLLSASSFFGILPLLVRW